MLSMSEPNVTMPYQRLARSGNILIAARGSSIDSFSLKDGSLLSTWTNASATRSPITGSSPPAKKRRICKEEGETQEEVPQENGKVQNGGSTSPKKEKKKQNNRLDAVSSGLEFPAIIALAVTEDGRHVITVTAEDKSIRVFEHISGEGGKQALVQISLRQMPKRPCAITLSADSMSIISADKFGDVYSLPLIPLAALSTPSADRSETTVVTPVLGPAANELTIHSKRNLRALQNQRRQTNAAPERKTDLAGTLLFGHVSMLTDIVLGMVENKSYVLTADRDEHIRVSRGIPQTHVVEGFCLGHEEFVTKLCVPRRRAGLLISGGGDDELYIWEWLTGKLIGKVDLKSHVVALMRRVGSEEKVTEGEERGSITLSGIFSIDSFLDLIVVTCEGIPGMFIFQLSSQNVLEHLQTVHLQGNALDVLTNTPSSNRLIVSVDTIRLPGSITEHRATLKSPVKPFQVFEISQDGKFVEDTDMAFACGGEASEGRYPEGNLTNLLYSLGNLRKRDGEDKED